VLSTPISITAPPNYRGLYRSEPFPQLNANNRMKSLWTRYIQYLEPLINMGITTELTLDELKHFANLATTDIGEEYEVILFSENLECQQKAVYYGIDVSGLGGYSIIGEGLFKNSSKISNDLYCLFDIISRYFRSKLNSNGLFNTIEDAADFREILIELALLSPNIVEQEDWHVLHIFKIIDEE
jgi:hypothetical protein